MSSRVEDPQELLAQAEMHQTTLEQEEQALVSLEHRLEHALSLSSSQDPISPGPVGKTLLKIKENVRRWDLFNMHMEDYVTDVRDAEKMFSTV